MSLEELMAVEIVSASRKKQRLTDAAVPVSLITAEDIHYSGLTNLYEVLQFAPSIDAIQVDRNRYALGVRGLHDTWSDRTLTLINGRAADNPLFGGSEFLRQPLRLEDIKQIEILRGPSGAAWGANAFNGAINIITKTPAECKGLLVSTEADHFGDNFHRLRWADTTETWGWRVSTAYDDVVSSSDALDRDFVTVGGLSVPFTSQDFRRTALIDTELRHDLSERTHLSLGFGHCDMETGGYEFLSSFLDEDHATETTRAFTKVDRDYENGSRLSAQWYGNFAHEKWPEIGEFSSSENQFEGQWDFSVHEAHRSTVGANLRLTNINQDVDRPDDVLIGDAREQRVGLFFLDHWEVTDRLDTYYERYRDLIGFDPLPTPEFAAQNLGPADAYGWESELMMHGSWYKVSLWYAYTYLTLEGDDPERDVRAYLPARHKAGTTLRFFLPRDWTINLNYKHSTFTDSDHGPWGEHVPGFDRLDLTLARPMRIGKAEGEIMLGVSDLFNDTEQLVSDEGSMFYQHETPGRTLFARLTLHF